MSKLNDKYDCCILGAGSAGLLMAKVLVDEGYRVALINTDKNHKHDFFHATTKHYLSILNSIGILDKFVESEVFIPARFLLKWDTKETKEKQSPVFLLNKNTHNDMLYEIATKQDGLDIFKGIVNFEETTHKNWVFKVNNHNFKTKIVINATGKPNKKLLDSLGKNIVLKTETKLTKTIASSFIWEDLLENSIPTVYSEALDHQWYWGWKIQNKAGLIVFSDKKTQNSELKTILKQSSVFDIETSNQTSKPNYYNATARSSFNSIGPNWINVGDAHIKHDPLSSQGLINCITSVLQAKVVINTLINHPEDSELAIRFYTDQASYKWKEHCTVLNELYSDAISNKARETNLTSSDLVSNNEIANNLYIQNPGLQEVETAVISNNKISTENAMTIPEFGQPIAYFNNQPVCEILKYFRLPVSLKDLINNGMNLRESQKLIQFLLIKKLIIKHM